MVLCNPKFVARSAFGAKRFELTKFSHYILEIGNKLYCSKLLEEMAVKSPGVQIEECGAKSESEGEKKEGKTPTTRCFSCSHLFAPSAQSERLQQAGKQN